MLGESHAADRVTEAALARHPAFGQLPEAARHALALEFRRRRYEAGTHVVREGDAGTEYYLIASGRAEVWGRGPRGDVLLATLEAGDSFGEVALLSTEGQRQATVRAVTELVIDALPIAAFRRIVENHPSLASHFDGVIDRHHVVRFLKLASPFSSLDPDRLRVLAAKLRSVEITVGTDIVRQGESSDVCYLLRTGKAEVVQTAPDGSRRKVADVGPGALIGEVALLSNAPRNASVRAVEPSELLALGREDLRAVTKENWELARAMNELVQLHGRPRRAPTVTEHPRVTPEGETVTVLRDADRHIYYRLSPEGRFVWQQLDGESTFKDLTLAYVARFGQFAPDRIMTILDGLARAGLLEGAMRRSLFVGAAVNSGLDRWLNRIRALLEWRVTLRHVDAFFAALYRWGGFLFFTRPVNAVLAVIVCLGMVATVLSFDDVAATFARTNLLVLLWLIPANALAIVLHELGHALATKDAGRVVRGAGVGWYWFQPVAFIDTTDVWLASRREQIRVGLAGPYVNLVLGSGAAVVAWVTSGLTALVALQVAAVNYIAVVINLNPLLEYDGYQVLVDWLDRPGLRRRAWQWLGANVPAALRDPRRLREEPLLLIYGVASVVYVMAMVAATVWLVRALFEQRLALLVSPRAALGIAWFVAIVIAVAASAGLWRDLRAARLGMGTRRRSSP